MKTVQNPDIKLVYDLLPLSEKTLLKRMKLGVYDDFTIKNDRGGPCDYYIYNGNGEPIGVVVYYKGRKLVLHGIEPAKEVKP